MDVTTALQNNNQRHARQRKLIASLSLLVIVVIAVASLLFVKYRQALNSNPTVQTNRLLSQVGQEVALPNETPIISTVLDKSKITNPDLAAWAQNGDKLLVYTNAKRLVLYRPSWHKVIDILDIQTSASAPNQSPNSASTVKSKAP